MAPVPTRAGLETDQQYLETAARIQAKSKLQPNPYQLPARKGYLFSPRGCLAHLTEGQIQDPHRKAARHSMLPKLGHQIRSPLALPLVHHATRIPLYPLFHLPGQTRNEAVARTAGLPVSSPPRRRRESAQTSQFRGQSCALGDGPEKRKGNGKKDSLQAPGERTQKNMLCTETTALIGDVRNGMRERTSIGACKHRPAASEFPATHLHYRQ